jgi:NarL family two-component system response regulator LiaR
MSGPPIRVLLDVCDVVHAGLDVLLVPFRDRIHIVGRLDLRPVDVEVFDPGDDRTRTRSRGGGAPRVALTWDPSSRTAAGALELGAVLVLPLSVSASDLVNALERVHRDPSVQSRPPRVQVLSAPLPLSPREVDVVRGICRGLSNIEIAAELELSVNSVKTYIRTAYRKMKVDSRSQAVLWGVTHQT